MTYRDFDAFTAEETAEPLTATVAGCEITLPGKLPARVGLKLLVAVKAAKSKDEELSATVMLDIAEGLLGDQLQKILDAGASFEQLEALINWAFECYGHAGKPSDEGDSGN